MNHIFFFRKKPPFKYRINFYLNLLPKGLSTSDFAYLLELDYKINRKEFDRDRALRVDNKEEIPSDRLKIYAFMFEVKEEQLKNSPTDKKNPFLLFQRKGLHY